MSRAAVFYSAVALQIAVLGFLVAREERVIRRGARVVLAIEAWDPSSFLSGRYLATPLAISRIDWTTLGDGAEPPSPGDAAFTELVEGEPHWTAARVHTVRPPAGDEAVFLEGRVTDRTGSLVTIDYGLDRFYFPETSRDPSLWTEGGTRNGLSLVVRVRAGRGVTEDLLVEGRPFAEWDRSVR